MINSEGAQHDDMYIIRIKDVIKNVTGKVVVCGKVRTFYSYCKYCSLQKFACNSKIVNFSLYTRSAPLIDNNVVAKRPKLLSTRYQGRFVSSMFRQLSPVASPEFAQKSVYSIYIYMGKR